MTKQHTMDSHGVLSTLQTLGQQLDATAIIILSTTLIVFFIPVLIIFPPIPVQITDILQQTHSKIGLPRERSKLSSTSSDDAPKIQSLHIYPVKSCREIELVRSKVIPSGLEHDRLYTFARLRNAADETQPQVIWEFLTQRECPLLANLDVDIWLPDTTKKLRSRETSPDGFIHVRFPRPRSQGRLRDVLALLAAKLSRGWRASPELEFLLPLGFPSDEDIAANGYEHGDVKIWKDVARALNLGSGLPAELKTYLGIKPEHRLGIFRIDPKAQREVYRCAPRKETLGYQPVVDFQDAYPIHLLGLNSVSDLKEKLHKDDALSNFDARRFRANIIVSGSKSYDEESWKTIRCTTPSTETSHSFDVCARTVRCKMPNIDQDTGARHRVEPDRALRKHRNVDPGAPVHGCLGMQLCPIFPDPSAVEDLELEIEVGMEIQVLERGEHSYIWL